MTKSAWKIVAIAALIVGAFGYVIGIFTAPLSGKETRAKIYKLKKRSAKKAAKELKALHSQLDDVVDDVDVQKAVKNLKAYLKNLR